MQQAVPLANPVSAINVTEAHIITRGKSLRLQCVRPGLGYTASDPITRMEGNRVYTDKQVFIIDSWKQ